MVTFTGLAGCYFAGSASVPAPRLTDASSPGFAPAPMRLRRETTRALPNTAVPESSLPPAIEPKVLHRPWKSIVLHHSATEGGDIPSIDAVHRRRKDRMGNPWLGIGYHFVVGNGRGMPDGSVEPTFRWRQQLQGAHAGNHEHNEAGIGICLIGNFDEQRPTSRQIAATRQLIETLVARYAIKQAGVLAHEDITATKCPGQHFPREEVVRGIWQLTTSPAAVLGGRGSRRAVRRLRMPTMHDAILVTRQPDSSDRVVPVSW